MPSIALGGIEYKASRMRYTLWDKASFPVTLHTIGYQKFMGDFGGHISYGKSDTKQNTIDTGYDTNSSIKRFFSSGLSYKYDIGRVRLISGVNYTEYKSCYSAWGCNPDTGVGYHLRMQYFLSSKYSVGISRDSYYRKHKKGLGEEITDGFGLYFTIEN